MKAFVTGNIEKFLQNKIDLYLD